MEETLRLGQSLWSTVLLCELSSHKWDDPLSWRAWKTDVSWQLASELADWYGVARLGENIWENSLRRNSSSVRVLWWFRGFRWTWPTLEDQLAGRMSGTHLVFLWWSQPRHSLNNCRKLPKTGPKTCLLAAQWLWDGEMSSCHLMIEVLAAKKPTTTMKIRHLYVTYSAKGSWKVQTLFFLLTM